MPEIHLEGMKLRDRFVYLVEWYVGEVPQKSGEVYKRVNARRRMRLDRQNKARLTPDAGKKETNNNWIRLGTVNAAGITTMYTIYTLHKPTPATAPWRLTDTSMQRV